MDSSRPGLLARIEAFLASHPWASVRVIAEELPRPIRAPLDPAGVSSLLLCLKRRQRVESRRQFEEGMPVLGYRLTAAACPVTAEMRQVQESIHPDVPARAVLLADVRRRRDERRVLIEQYAQPVPPLQLDTFAQLLEDLR